MSRRTTYRGRSDRATKLRHGFHNRSDMVHKAPPTLLRDAIPGWQARFENGILPAGAGPICNDKCVSRQLTVGLPASWKVSSVLLNLRVARQQDIAATG